MLFSTTVFIFVQWASIDNAGPGNEAKEAMFRRLWSLKEVGLTANLITTRASLLLSVTSFGPVVVAPADLLPLVCRASSSFLRIAQLLVYRGVGVAQKAEGMSWARF